MKFSNILAASKRYQRRREFLGSIMGRRDILSYLRYLFYRGRLPITYRILLRAIVLVELYQIFQKIPGLFFFETSLFIFILFQLRSFLRSASGYFRNIIFYKINKEPPESAGKAICQSLTSLGKLSVFLSLFAALSLSVVWKNDQFQWFYQVGLILLLPLEIISSHLWSLVYLEHRLPRGMMNLVIIRCIPLLYLFIASRPLALIYLSLMLIARISENIYLLLLAARQLKKRSYCQTLKPLQDNFSDLIFHSRLFRKYFFFSAGLPLYELIIGLILYLRDKNYWLVYLSFSLLMGLLTYFSLQPARAQLFDIFNFARRGRHQAVRFFWQRIRRSSLLIASVMAVAIIALTVSAPGSAIISQRFYPVILYLAALLILRSGLLTALGAIEALALERFFYRAQLKVLGIAVICQFIAMIVLRGNLQLCLLLECLTFLILHFCLRPDRFFEYSLFARSCESASADCKSILSPVAWIMVARKLLPAGSHRLWIGETDVTQNDKTALLCALSDRRICACRLYGRILLLLVPIDVRTPPFFRWLLPLKSESAEELVGEICSFVRTHASTYGRTLGLLNRLNFNFEEFLKEIDTPPAGIDKDNFVRLREDQISGSTLANKNRIHRDYVTGRNDNSLFRIIPGAAALFQTDQTYIFIFLHDLDFCQSEKIKSVFLLKSLRNFLQLLSDDSVIRLSLFDTVRMRTFLTQPGIFFNK